MEVNEPEDVETSERLQLVDQPDELGGAQTELGFLTSALRPPSRAFRVELDAHSSRRVNSQLVGYFEKDIHFAQLLEHDEDLMPERLTHEGKAHELLVLVPVADDHVIGVLRQSEHCLELRLAAALQSNAGRLAEFNYL